MTPHNKAEMGDFAPVVIMPGDPLRAKYIVEKYFDDYKLVNDKRNALGYTGHYKGKLVSVMSSGMGIPSMGIYSYELYKFYGVEKIIRVGSCGSYKENIKVGDLILVDKAATYSNFAQEYQGEKTYVAESSKELNNKILETAKNKGININVGNIYTSEAFYNFYDDFNLMVKEYDCLGVEMEAFALFCVAKNLGKEAATILTASDSLLTKDAMDPDAREKQLNEMIELALDSI